MPPISSSPASSSPLGGHALAPIQEEQQWLLLPAGGGLVDSLAFAAKAQQLLGSAMESLRASMYVELSALRGRAEDLEEQTGWQRLLEEQPEVAELVNLATQVESRLGQQDPLLLSVDHPVPCKSGELDVVNVIQTLSNVYVMICRCYKFNKTLIREPS